LTQVGLEPKLIMGFSLPTSWKQFHNLYKELGLVATKRWRLCTRSTQAPHDPHLMSPSVEDLYEGFEVVCYECGLNSGQKFKRDCPGCSHKCPICLQIMKHILAYDYMPIKLLLASLYRSKSICWFWPKIVVFACKLGVFVQHTTSITTINRSTQNQRSPHITSNWLQSHIPLGYNKVVGLVGMVWKAHVIVSNFITHHNCLKTWNLYHFHWLHLWIGCWSNLFKT
jgi:hypothetical protein